MSAASPVAGPLLRALAEWASMPGVSDITLGSWGMCAVRQHRVWRRLDLGAGLSAAWQDVRRSLGREGSNPGPRAVSAAVEFSGRRWRASWTSCAAGEELVLRPLPVAIPTAAELGLPEGVLRRFCALENGLFLVCGATGMGKSTSIASLVAARARERGGKYVTLEAPIEHLYVSEGDAVFIQREVGVHVTGFAAGLEEALHQSPDVIVVQEVRDGASAEAALSAALTGHLVVASLHAPAAHLAPQRLLALMPTDPEGGGLWREALATTLQAVLVQELRALDGGGVRAAFEFLNAGSGTERGVAVERALREGDWKAVRQSLEAGTRSGSFPFGRASSEAPG